jgi:hypothetical protein
VEGVRENQKILAEEEDNKTGSRENMGTKTVAEGFTRTERSSDMLTLLMWFVIIFGTWYVLDKLIDRIIKKFF